MFSTEDVQKIREELNSVLSSYGGSKNIEFKIGSISYDNDSFRTTLKGSNTESGKDSYEIDFHKYRNKFSIPADWYGREISLKSGKYRICGISGRARKSPIFLRHVTTGKVESKIGVSEVMNLLT